MTLDKDFEKQISGASLITAEITYHMPDCLQLLQTYVWQDYDFAPDFPMLYKFLNFWDRKIEGPLHSVIVGEQKLIMPSDLRLADAVLTLH